MSPVPDIQSSPLFDAQSVADSTDWLNISAGFSVTGLISGCVVTALVSPAMEVAVSAGSVACSGVITAISAASVIVPTASTSDRRDIIIGMPTGAASIVTGTPCGTANWTRTTYPGLPPVKPAIPSNCVFLAEVYVAATTTSIISGNIELSPTQLLVTSQYVTNFNGRNGPVTLAAADIDGTFTAAGQLPVGTGSGSGEYLTAGSVGTVLTSQGSSAVPQWLPPTGGGAASAGVSTYNSRFGAVTSQASDVESTFGAKGQLFVGTGSGTGELLNPGNANFILTSNGAASIPSWQSASVAVDSAFTTAGQLIVGTGSGTGELLNAGSVGTVLTSNGATSVPSWQAVSSGSVTAAAIESTFTGKGQLYVGTGVGTGEQLTAGSVGYVLTSNGPASVPSWQASSGGGAMTLISSIVLGSSGASISFTSIPGTYNHLLLKITARSTVSAETDYFIVQLNGNGSDIYDLNYVQYQSGTATATNLNASSEWFTLKPDIPGASATSGVAGTLTLDLPLYAKTTFYKTCSWRSGFNDGATAQADAYTTVADGTWRLSNAITSITVTPANGPNFVAGSAGYLYGIL